MTSAVVCGLLSAWSTVLIRYLKFDRADAVHVNGRPITGEDGHTNDDSSRR